MFIKQLPDEQCLKLPLLSYDPSVCMSLILFTFARIGVLEWYLVLCVVLTNLSQLNMQILGCGAYTEKDFWAA